MQTDRQAHISLCLKLQSGIFSHYSYIAVHIVSYTPQSLPSSGIRLAAVLLKIVCLILTVSVITAMNFVVLLLAVVELRGKKLNLYLVSNAAYLFLGQIIPSDFLYFDTETGPVNGSSGNGNCVDVSSEFFDDRGLLLSCEAPTTSVLFDGNVPTLSQLDGNMWASQLLTARHNRAAIPSALLFIDFFNVLGGVGAERVELVMFNCPEWNITVQTIDIQDIIADEVIGSLNLTLSSCESLVKVCIPVTTLFQPMAGILLTFPDTDSSRWIHLAEVTFYSSIGNNCVPETLFMPAGGTFPDTSTGRCYMR